MSEQLLQDAQRAHQAGQLADSARLYHEFLGAYPAYVPALYALGVIYFQQSQFDQAEFLFGQSLKVDPMFAEGMCMRGVTLVKLNRPDEALASFEQALRVKPDFIEARSNQATALLELGRMRDGLEALDRVLADDPTHVLSLNNRGNALFALKRYQEAVESYDRALAIHPEFADARQNRLLALGELNRGGPRFVEILRAQGEDMMRRGQYANALKRFDEALAIKPDDPEAIAHRATTLREGFRSLFDECATEYEESMINSLNYRGHIQVRELADRVWTGAKTGLRVLDIGCGTGLVGDQFKQWTAGGRLDGIDFAPNMLELARKRAIYHNLILGELEQFLQKDGETYELLVAADTIIYLSDLTPIFTGAAKRLSPGGQFIFSAEAKNGEGWEETPKHRFRHSESYLRELAARIGLQFVAITSSMLRFESGMPVAGFTAAVQK
jgi:predicted TPR repeat methyltransferase/predicted negative regulator of RcsB-dependent stress response